ncbi:4-hydroxythreonine-4-phosphate dehydrogenase PdxA [Paralcaligenes sp. KSB-10]|uniref:4-hydroxythreonine-4-phosphate dehydrogenase PdxA n=1 Tax=Paralcaligenes sp. KSB-10 TaxID=2901142 RepID=UPI001E3A573A|nr:4-hydroxythreonine-4-phosphate dehydrogenase PdxA [Paralcaligenes sp. KSB-10]UHL63213.1 4-hydroxythreonine-4-phosphate dehydrogenase PdxA [Paralcaligenes sp. KSB-10]
MPAQKPTIALTLGDPAGIGPELIAKLLNDPANLQQGNIVLIGDPWLWEAGQKAAGVAVATQAIASLADARGAAGDKPLFVAVDSVAPGQVRQGQAAASGGASVLKILNLCMDAVMAGQIDAICFAPLNKHAMKQSGMKFEDELHHFANYLKVDTYFCEFNTLDGLWTSRVSSHVPLKDATSLLSKERIEDASRLIYDSLKAAGIAQPRVAVSALNPHGGDGGSCGREEIDIIEPAVRSLQQQGYPVEGPFPADTIFIKARDGKYDAIVTMYHDQGQIAIKLLGFEKGVTVQGGLPIPITTPAHGTAYDIAGKNLANVNAMRNAYLIACRMGEAYRKRWGES